MTTIEVDTEVWRHLHLKKRPGDSFNDVLRRELGLDDSPTAEHDSEPDAPASAGVVSRARDALAGWDPDNADSQQARDATVAVVGWLADTGAWQTRSEIVAWLETSAVASEKASSTKWRKYVAPGLRALRDDHGLVEQVRNKGWRVVDGDGDGD